MNWTEDQPMVSIKNVHKSFGELEVLKGVSIDVMKGEFHEVLRNCPVFGAT